MFDYYLGWTIAFGLASFSWFVVEPLAKWADNRGWAVLDYSTGQVKQSVYWWFFRALAVFFALFAYFGDYS